MRLSKIKKILVLGSNSFAGSWFIDGAIKKNIKVIGVSRSKENSVNFLKYKSNKLKKNFKFHNLDLNIDNKKIINLIKYQKPEIIVDFAGQGMVAQSWNYPHQWYNTNIVSKVKIHNAIKNEKFLKQYIRISTPEVYGNSNKTLKENSSINPSTPYAVSHAAIDKSLDIFFKEYNFPVITCRFSNFYGPFQQLYRIIPKAFLSALMHKKLPLHGGGKSIRSFIYGDDIVSAIFKIIDAGKLGETYHFSSDEFISIYNLLKKISHIVDVNMDKFVEITEDRRGKDHMYKMNANKAKNELLWLPNTNLDKGLQKTYNWVIDNFDKLKDQKKVYIHKK